MPAQFLPVPHTPQFFTLASLFDVKPWCLAGLFSSSSPVAAFFFFFLKLNRPFLRAGFRLFTFSRWVSFFPISRVFIAQLPFPLFLSLVFLLGPKKSSFLLLLFLLPTAYFLASLVIANFSASGNLWSIFCVLRMWGPLSAWTPELFFFFSFCQLFLVSLGICQEDFLLLR